MNAKFPNYVQIVRVSSTISGVPIVAFIEDELIKYDSHKCVNNGKFTAPISGTYQITTGGQDLYGRYFTNSNMVNMPAGSTFQFPRTIQYQHGRYTEYDGSISVLITDKVSNEKELFDMLPKGLFNSAEKLLYCNPKKVPEGYLINIPVKNKKTP